MAEVKKTAVNTAERKSVAVPKAAVKTVPAKTTAADPAVANKTEKVVPPKADKKVAGERKFYNRLHEKYIKEVIPALLSKYKNVNRIPKLNKIVVNMRLGDVKDNTKSFTGAVEELALITGRKPIVTVAKKSISNFKVREGQKIGAKVTLRGKVMYEFLDKVLSVALPRVRDFSGISPKSFDNYGNYTLGFAEQLVFPEISYEKIEKIRGFDISFVTTAADKAESLEFLMAMGFPFKKV